MNVKSRTIEVDKATADTLKARAAERGVSVSKLVAELAHETGPVAVEPEAIAELDRQWAKIESGQATVANEEVVRWLETWGTPAFKPWRER